MTIIIIMIIIIAVVAEKESNKAINVDVASQWDHRVHEKEREPIGKCQDLKREIGKLWGIDSRKWYR